MASQPDPAETIYQLATAGDPPAMAFLRLWSRYCHQIDDVIDAKEKNADAFLEALATANMIYSSDFYAHFPAPLGSAVMLITSAYEDSLAWEQSTEEWQRQWADTLRFAGNEMVLAVAGVCGGYDRIRQVSLLLREDSWKAHHAQGQPI